MIQRIQTVYLLLVTVLSGWTLFGTQAKLISTETSLTYLLNFRGVVTATPDGGYFVSLQTWALTALCLLFVALSVATIFLYKKRLLQIRLCIVNGVLLVGYYALLFIYLWQAGKVLAAEWYLQLPAAFPLVALILIYLAIRAIAKDQALVKSLNRIR